MIDKKLFRIISSITAMVVMSSCRRTSREAEAPLPQGPVHRTVGFGLDLTSRLFLNVRLDLDTLEKGIEAAIPPYQKITNQDPKVDATLKVRDFDLYRVNINRVGAKTKLDVDGGVQWGPFTAQDMTLTANGDLALALSSAWEWQVAPNLTLKLNKVDARPALPDALVKELGNLASGWFVPSIVGNISNNLPPVKPLAKELWKQAHQQVTIIEAPCVKVSSEPIAVLLRQPVLDDATNDLDFGLGADVRLLADVSQNPSANSKDKVQSDLPAIANVDGSIRSTSLFLPLIVELGELQRNFETQSIPWDDGRVEVSRVELNDADGVLYSRIHFSSRLPSAYATTVLRQFAGSLSFQIKPGCDSAAGNLKFENFSFTPSTDSWLVNLIGSVARDSLARLIQNELPTQLDTTLRALEASAQVEGNHFLIQQRDALASTTPQFADLLRASKLQVADLRVRPHTLQVREGYFLCVVRVDANLSITME